MRARWRDWRSRDDGDPPRTPSLRQIQETECGVIALAIVLAHHGAWVPLPELRRRCEVSEQGVTAASLVTAARHFGLAVRAMRLDVEVLRHLPAPVVLFWENEHFVVLEGIRGDTAWVNDPARGHRRVSLAEPRTSYSGLALMAQPGPAFQTRGSPSKPYRTAVDILRPGRLPLALMATAALAESALLPLALRRAGDTMIRARDGKPANARSVGIPVTGLLVAGVARRWLSGIARDAGTSSALRRLDRATDDAPPDVPQWRPAPFRNRQELARYPAETAVSVLTAGIRMTVAVPLLMLAIGRIHPAAGVVAMGALASPVLVRQATIRDARGREPAAATLETRIGASWSTLRPVIELSPVLAVAIFRSRDTLPAVIETFLASWFAFRLVDSAVRTTGMLYLLPESIVQLSDADTMRFQSGTAHDDGDESTTTTIALGNRLQCQP